jgi:hypothetical protein
LPCSSSLPDSTFYPVVQQQAEHLSKTFLPKRDLPFVLDRRVSWAIVWGACVTLLFLFVPLVSEHPFSSPSQQEEARQDFAVTTAIAALEKTARFLIAPSSRPEEQLAGAQLLALVQQVQNPSLSTPEKQKLIEETQKRLNLDLPLPQFFPFDLKIFAGKGKEDQNQRNEGNSQQGATPQLAEANRNLEQLKQSLAGQTKNEAGQDGQKNEEKSEKPQPRSAGGGITFNFPPPSPNPPSSPSNSSQTSGSQQPQTNNQTPPQPDSLGPSQSGLASKVDPNRPEKNPRAQTQNSQNQGYNPEKPGGEQEKKGEGGATIGQGRGERFLKPGEKPGGGFLTKDARFVKVRVPAGREEEREGDTLAENASRATPKIPYSNVPLKEGPPDQAQAKQPIPLEYRSILTEQQ